MRITQGFLYEGKLSDARLTDEVGAPSSLCLSRQTVHPAEVVDAEEGGDAFEDLVGIEQHHHDERDDIIDDQRLVGVFLLVHSIYPFRDEYVPTYDGFIIQ